VLPLSTNFSGATMKLKRMSAALAASIAALGLFASSAYAVYDTSVKNDATTALPESKIVITAASQTVQNAPAPLTDQQRAVDQAVNKEVEASGAQVQSQTTSVDQGITKVQQAPTAAWAVAPAYMQGLTVRGADTSVLVYVSTDQGYASDGATVITRQAAIDSTQAAQPATTAHQLT